jgi:hypothetical protein
MSSRPGRGAGRGSDADEIDPADQRGERPLLERPVGVFQELATLDLDIRRPAGRSWPERFAPFAEVDPVSPPPKTASRR